MDRAIENHSRRVRRVAHLIGLQMPFIRASTKKSLYLGYEYSSQALHPGARLPYGNSLSLLNPAKLITAATRAELSGIDFLVLADSLDTTGLGAASFEPMTLAAYLAGKTQNLGLVVSADPSYAQPFNLARLIASIDHISHGRAGWNILDGASGNASHNHQWAGPQSDEAGAEYLNVVRKLWDSWEGDAFLRDKSSGVFVNADKIHTIAHKGPTLSVQGPLNVARTPQGQIPVFAYWSQQSGRQLQDLDVLRIGVQSLEQASVVFKHLHSRQPDWQGRVVSDVLVLLANDDGAAWQRLDHLDKQLEVDIGALSAYVDVALPYLADTALSIVETETFNAAGQFLLHTARDRLSQRQKALGLPNLNRQPTSRQLFQAWQLPGRLAIGSPDSVAENLITWVDETGVEGVTLRSIEGPSQLDRFNAELITSLIASGELIIGSNSLLLRDNLNLDNRANQYEHPKA